MDRRRFIAGSAAAAAALATGPGFADDAYPSHAITFINPFPPGGAADVVGRPIAAVLEPILKQPCVIETKAGAAGQVGAQFAATAKPDGYTLLIHIVSISGFAEVDKLFGRQPKFTRADFTPIARLTAGPMVLVVNDQQPYKTLKELVEDAKKNPDKLIFSSSGLYGALHLPMALFLMMSFVGALPRELIQAARMDGCSYGQVFWRIVFPQLAPVVLASSLLQAILAFQSFGPIFTLTDGGPGNATTILPLYVYKTAFTLGEMGLAAAAAVVLVVIIMSLCAAMLAAGRREAA